MDNRDIIVIGGSSGATAPPQDDSEGPFPRSSGRSVQRPAHSRTHLGILTTVSAAASPLPVHAAIDGMPIEKGNIYLGVPDRRLIITGGQMRLGRGPRENMARPTIDPLFRSAAVTYGSRVIGIVLSGLLNDGAVGLEAVKRCGGSQSCRTRRMQLPTRCRSAHLPQSRPIFPFQASA